MPPGQSHPIAAAMNDAAGSGHLEATPPKRSTAPRARGWLVGPWSRDTWSHRHRCLMASATNPPPGSHRIDKGRLKVRRKPSSLRLMPTASFVGSEKAVKNLDALSTTTSRYRLPLSGEHRTRAAERGVAASRRETSGQNQNTGGPEVKKGGSVMFGPSRESKARVAAAAVHVWEAAGTTINSTHVEVRQ